MIQTRTHPTTYMVACVCVHDIHKGVGVEREHFIGIEIVIAQSIVFEIEIPHRSHTERLWKGVRCGVCASVYVHAAIPADVWENISSTMRDKV